MLIALGFVGLVAFIGLAIDAGIVFAHIGHLRRGVDAASLAAANQIRSDWNEDEAVGAAEELILLNLPSSQLSDLNVLIETCKPPTTLNDCAKGGVNRKLAYVSATLDVNLAFLPIVGWDSVQISAEAISEAASVDLMIVIDTSTSMAYETQSVIDNWENLGDRASAIDECRLKRGTVEGCMPFENVRTAAGNLVDSMFATFDRIGLVTFDRFAGLVDGVPGEESEVPKSLVNQGLTNTHSDVKNALNAMNVYPVPDFDKLCPDFNAGNDTGDPRGCMRTNTAAGLMLAGKELTQRGREEAVWVIVLLSDGVANAAYHTVGFAPPEPTNIEWYCPPEFWSNPDDPFNGRVFDRHLGPWCTNGGYPRGPVGDPNNPTAWPNAYVNGVGLGDQSDANAAARYWADWLGCLPGSANKHCAQSGKGVVMFTIALGDLTTNYDGPFPNVGESLLRYIANVGYDGNPSLGSTDQCWKKPVKADCGNYYHSKTDLAELIPIFEAIAERIFTRLTH